MQNTIQAKVVCSQYALNIVSGAVQVSQYHPVLTAASTSNFEDAKASSWYIKNTRAEGREEKILKRRMRTKRQLKKIEC